MQAPFERLASASSPCEDADSHATRSVHSCGNSRAVDVAVGSALTSGTLARELAMRLSAAQINAFGATLGPVDVEDAAASVAELLARDLSPLLFAPAGGFVSTLREKSEVEVRAKSNLFWRCAVALLAMPISALRAIAVQKCAHVPSLKALVPPRGDTSTKAHMRLVRAVVPWFSMTALSREQVAESERRKAKAAAAAVSERAPAAGASRSSSSSSGGASGRSAEAAAHVYDKGYARWETFDADAAALAVDERGASAGAVPASSAAAASSMAVAAPPTAATAGPPGESALDTELRTKVAALRASLAEQGGQLDPQLDRAIQSGDLLQIAGLLASQVQEAQIDLDATKEAGTI